MTHDKDRHKTGGPYGKRGRLRRAWEDRNVWRFSGHGSTPGATEREGAVDDDGYEVDVVVVHEPLRHRLTAWLVGLIFCILGAAVALMLANTFIAYDTYTLEGYRVTPEVVCTGDPVKATVTRQFTEQVESLTLEETWVVYDVPGLSRGAPVSSAQGTIRNPKVNAAPIEVRSPLVTNAPGIPGVYRIRISATVHGTRWGFMPVSQDREFYSVNRVKVISCED